MIVCNKICILKNKIRCKNIGFINLTVFNVFLHFILKKSKMDIFRCPFFNFGPEGSKKTLIVTDQSQKF